MNAQYNLSCHVWHVHAYAHIYVLYDDVSGGRDKNLVLVCASLKGNSKTGVGVSRGLLTSKLG